MVPRKSLPKSKVDQFNGFEGPFLTQQTHLRVPRVHLDDPLPFSHRRWIACPFFRNPRLGHPPPGNRIDPPRVIIGATVSLRKRKTLRLYNIRDTASSPVRIVAPELRRFKFKFAAFNGLEFVASKQASLSRTSRRNCALIM